MRRVLFAAASLALVAVLVLIGRYDAGTPFLRALLANLAVVTWSSFVLPLRGLPPVEGYYRLRAWERSGAVFRWLGVPLFRALVRRGPLSWFNRALPAAWRDGDPERIERETRAAEGGHWTAFLVVLALAAWELVRGEPARAVWLATLDVPINLYPVLLQREHRHRLGEMVRAGELRREGTPHAAGERGWSHFPHGADIGVEGSAPTLEGAFEEAARALTAIVLDPDLLERDTEVALACEAPDEESLLVDWLNAVLYEMATRRMAFGRFDVRLERRAGGLSLRANARGQVVDPERQELAVEPKGATFTALSVRRRPDGAWVARCVVDV
jgi:SHS2 domain-containing protein